MTSCLRFFGAVYPSPLSCPSSPLLHMQRLRGGSCAACLSFVRGLTLPRAPPKYSALLDTYYYSLPDLNTQISFRMISVICFRIISGKCSSVKRGIHIIFLNKPKQREKYLFGNAHAAQHRSCAIMEICLCKRNRLLGAIAYFVLFFSMYFTHNAHMRARIHPSTPT